MYKYFNHRDIDNKQYGEYRRKEWENLSSRLLNKSAIITTDLQQSVEDNHSHVWPLHTGDCHDACPVSKNSEAFASEKI